MSIHVSLHESLHVSIRVSLHVFLHVSLHVSIYVFLHVFLFSSLCVSSCLLVSVCLFVTLPVSMSRGGNLDILVWLFLDIFILVSLYPDIIFIHPKRTSLGLGQTNPPVSKFLNTTRKTYEDHTSNCHGNMKFWLLAVDIETLQQKFDVNGSTKLQKTFSTG